MSKTSPAPFPFPPRNLLPIVPLAPEDLNRLRNLLFLRMRSRGYTTAGQTDELVDITIDLLTGRDPALAKDSPDSALQAFERLLASPEVRKVVVPDVYVDKRTTVDVSFLVTPVGVVIRCCR